MIAIMTSAIQFYIKVSYDINERIYELSDMPNDIHSELLE
jgi:hypothetical protein